MDPINYTSLHSLVELWVEMLVFCYIHFVSRFDGTSSRLVQLPRGVAQTAYNQLE